MAFNAGGYNPHNSFQAPYGAYRPALSSYGAQSYPSYTPFNQQAGGYAGYRYATTRPYYAEPPRFLYVSQPAQTQNNNSWDWVKFSRTAVAVAAGGLTALLLAKNVTKNEIKSVLPEPFIKILRESFGSEAGKDGASLAQTVKELPDMFNQVNAIFEGFTEASGKATGEVGGKAIDEAVRKTERIAKFKKIGQQINAISEAVAEVGDTEQLKELGKTVKALKDAVAEVGDAEQLKELGKTVKALKDAVAEVGDAGQLKELGQKANALVDVYDRLGGAQKAEEVGQTTIKMTEQITQAGVLEKLPGMVQTFETILNNIQSSRLYKYFFPT